MAHHDDLLDQPDGLGTPFAKSTGMHLLVVGLLVGYGYMHNLIHGTEWGANSFQQGAIQATLVSSAALPLPQDHPPTDNVLATETPSVAPALDEQKTQPLPLPDAVPIPEKQTPAKPQAKPKPVTPPQHQPPPKPQNKANYGEAAPANMPRSTASNTNANSPIAVSNRGRFRLPLWLVRRRDQAQGGTGLVFARSGSEHCGGLHCICAVHRVTGWNAGQRFHCQSQQFPRR